MQKLSNEQRAAFMALDPRVLLVKENTIGQTVVFYEHPEYGEDDSIYADIKGVMVDTDFFDLDDLNHSNDYMPVLLDDGSVKCEFETDLNTPTIEQAISTIQTYLSEACEEQYSSPEHESTRNDIQRHWDYIKMQLNKAALTQ